MPTNGYVASAKARWDSGQLKLQQGSGYQVQESTRNENSQNGEHNYRDFGSHLSNFDPLPPYSTINAQNGEHDYGDLGSHLSNFDPPPPSSIPTIPELQQSYINAANTPMELNWALYYTPMENNWASGQELSGTTPTLDLVPPSSIPTTPEANTTRESINGSILAENFQPHPLNSNSHVQPYSDDYAFSHGLNSDTDILQPYLLDALNYIRMEATTARESIPARRNDSTWAYSGSMWAYSGS